MTKEKIKKQIKELKVEIDNMDHHQNALKVLMNAEYGAMGNRWCRYYNIDLASAITLSGQWAIIWIENYLMNHPLRKKYKWKILYSDTDSCFLSIEYVVNELQKKYKDINELLNKIEEFSTKIIEKVVEQGYEKLKEYCNANENRMFMKREKIIQNVLWTGKKKYAMNVWDDEGVRYKEPKMTVKGFEIVKSSTPKVCRDSLKKAVKLVLSDRGKLIEFIKEEKKKFFKMTPEEIAFPRGVNNIKKYQSKRLGYIKGTPINVRAAITYNKYIEDNELESQFPIIQEGEKIRFIMLRLPNPWHENVIGFLKYLPKEVYEYVDYPLMYQKAFFSVLDNIQKKILTKIEFKNKIDINSLFT